MPVPTQTVGGAVNPYSTVTQPASPLNKQPALNFRLTGLAASTPYTVGTPNPQQLPALYYVTCDGTVEWALYADTGGDNNLVKAAGSSGFETVDNGGAATASKISLSKINTTGALTVVTGATSVLGPAISIFKIV